MTILEEISADLAALSPRAIAQAESMLSEPEKGEVVIGTILSAQGRGFWALSLEYKRQSYLAAHAAAFDVTDEGERKQLTAKASRFNTLAEAVREVAWIVMKDEIGLAAYDPSSIGLRAGYQMVTCPDDDDEEKKTSRVGVAAVSLGSALGKALRNMLEGAEKPNPEPPKPKVQ